jgi:hypothetical protein
MFLLIDAGLIVFDDAGLIVFDWLSASHGFESVGVLEKIY